MSQQHHLLGAPVVALGIPEFVTEALSPLQCREDPDAYFTDGLRPGQARVLCTGCGYVELCGAYALERPELWGVWGGTTRREREALRRRAA
ncbi:WhiB family transcriptional regulator [Streptomyces sp. NPDC086787]|uniref:WhiB family transcriptional regulator n=1 Tax=Streptomyces sp. NPDC086787 TaxID=3365759 RepID=UPI0037FD462D